MHWIVELNLFPNISQDGNKLLLKVTSNQAQKEDESTDSRHSSKKMSVQRLIDLRHPLVDGNKNYWATRNLWRRGAA